MTIALETATAFCAAEITFARFTADHLPGAFRLSQAEGWPHRREDWALALMVSDGFVALSEGEVVGTGLCSRFGETACLNMIIVAEAMRRRGLGRALMKRIIPLAGARGLRLVATADGAPLYKKMGFTQSGEILQHQGRAQPQLAPRKPTLQELQVQRLEGRVASLADLRALAQLDSAATGMDRRELFARIAKTSVILRVDQGFALLRDFGRGKVIGPIVAQDAHSAGALLRAGVHHCQGQFLRVDFTSNSGLTDLAENHGLLPVGGGLAMSLPPHPVKTTGTKTFALISQALG